MDVENHANVVVLDRNFSVAYNSGMIAEVHPFSNEHEALEVTIVDTVAQCNNPCSEVICMLVSKESLNVPAMKHNPIPSLLIREAD